MRMVFIMKVLGIITEYNPMHKGHIFHLEQSIEKSKADAVVCVMSGNYAQRGLPTIMNKWHRAKLAIENGIDLVLELPTLYSVSSAEFFSWGAVSILHNIGIIDELYFGSECGDIEILKKISKVLIEEPIEYVKFLRNFLDFGLSFPDARSKALLQYLSSFSDFTLDAQQLASILSSSNNILGIEYCKAAQKLNSNINLKTISRIGSEYNDNELNDVFSSATSIRKFIMSEEDISTLKNHVPHNVLEYLTTLKLKHDFINSEDMFKFIKHKFITTADSFKKLPDISEGLENRIKKAVLTSESLEEAILKAKSKRYTHTRISRLLCQFFIGFEHYDTRNMRTEEAPYARVLAFNDTGAVLLKKMKKSSKIPIINKVSKTPINLTLNLDIQSTNTYSLLGGCNLNEDFVTSPLYIK